MLPRIKINNADRSNLLRVAYIEDLAYVYMLYTLLKIGIYCSMAKIRRSYRLMIQFIVQIRNYDRNA